MLTEVTKRIYDVVVVGAGPAGSTASYYLSKNSKLNILLLDRNKFPREKACGGILNHLDQLNEFENYKNIEQHLSYYPIKNIRFYLDNKFAFQRTRTTMFKQVNRYEFDNLLFKESMKQKNVTFRVFNVSSIAQKNNLFELSDGEDSIYARYVIGADGWNSVTSRFLGNKRKTRNEYALCLEYKICCKKKTKATHIFYFYKKEIGYAWIIPSLSGYYLGLGIVKKPKKNITIYLKEFVRMCKRKGFIPKEHTNPKLVGAPIPIQLSPNYSNDNIILCGDALGLVKQPTGEGIYYAMTSGKIAGELLCQSFNDISKRYQKIIKPYIKSVNYMKHIPHRNILYITFNILAYLFVNSKLPKRLKRAIQNRFVSSLLDW